MGQFDHNVYRQRLSVGFPAYFKKYISQGDEYWEKQYDAAAQIAQIIQNSEILTQQEADECTNIYNSLNGRECGSGWMDLGMHLNAFIKHFGLISLVFKSEY